MRFTTCAYRALLVTILLSGVFGCSDDNNTDDKNNTQTMDMGTTSMDMNTNPGDMTAADMAMSVDMAAADMTMMVDMPTGPLEDGASCTNGGECMSGRCFEIGFFGNVCGACTADSHCAGGGCSAPTITSVGGSVCNMGERGSGCETTEACSGDLVCVTALDISGVISLKTCGECDDDSLCSDGTICERIFTDSFTRTTATCIAPGTLELDRHCTRDDACASGICAFIDVPGLTETTACGECRLDDDCPGTTCVQGSLDLQTWSYTGSRCM